MSLPEDIFDGSHPVDGVEIPPQIRSEERSASAVSGLPAVPGGEEAGQSGKGGNTYGQILKSSVLIGGSSVIGIFSRIIRVKFVAYLLGPAGVGLFGVYNSVALLAENIAGLGVSSSGIRQIAAAKSTGDMERVALADAVLQRTSLVLGLIGAVALALLARPISIVTFGDADHTRAILYLSIGVFLQLIAWGELALVEGLRRIADVAKASVIATVIGTLLGVPLVYWFGQDGVVPSLVLLNFLALATAWWYSRKVGLPKPHIKPAQVFEEVSELLKLGSIFMMGWMLQSAVAYLARTLILRRSGLDAAGLYQSAWAMGGLYAGLIIQSMAADFYPRLTSAAKDNALTNRLVNEQARLGMLIAGPGVLITVTFTPLVMTLFYTAKFTAAVDVMRWISVGTLLQVVTWPMGYILVAKNQRVLYFWSELCGAIFYATACWVFISKWGLNGAGIAFFAYCAFHGLFNYPIIRHLSHFRWSRENLREGTTFLALIAAVCAGFRFLPWLAATGLGAVVAAASCIYAVHTIVRLLPWDRVPKQLQRVILMLGIKPVHQDGE